MFIRHILRTAAAVAAGIALSDTGTAGAMLPLIADPAAAAEASRDVVHDPSNRALESRDSTEIRERILDVLARFVGDQPEMGEFAALDMDQYDIAAFLCEVEEALGVYIPDHVGERLTSVEGVVEYVQAHPEGAR
ncbi:hypothetical protein GCM10027088_67500 [Nocardia goodfellowii]